MLRQYRRHRARKDLARLAAGKPVREGLDWGEFLHFSGIRASRANLDARALLKAVSENPHMPDDVREKILDGLTRKPYSIVPLMFDLEHTQVACTLKEAEMVLSSKLLTAEQKLRYFVKAWGAQDDIASFDLIEAIPVATTDWEEDAAAGRSALVGIARRNGERILRIAVEALRYDPRSTYRAGGVVGLVERLAQEDDDTLEVYWALVHTNDHKDGAQTEKYLSTAKLFS